MTNIGFIGTGMMAEAIMGGMLKGGFPAAAIFGADPLAARREYIRDRYGVRTVDDNAELAAECDVLVLAVKPQYYPQVVPVLQPALQAKHSLLSIMAGVSLDRLEKDLFVSGEGAGRALPMIRVVPNTPALVGAGVTALCKGSLAGPEQMELARKIFHSVGTVVEAPEAWLDAITGVAGCGPAYVYMMIEALADGGVLLGLPRQLAQTLAAEMVKGSAQMVAAGALHPGELKDRVCSPGGATIEGVYALEQAGFRAALMAAVKAGADKCKKL